MSIQLSVQSLHDEMRKAMIARDSVKINNYRFLLSEIQRGKKKEYSEAEILTLLKQLLSQANDPDIPRDKRDKETISFLESLLPETVDDEVVLAWIKDNVDFSKLNNKLAATKMVVSHFGVAVNGGTVRKIIETNF